MSYIREHYETLLADHYSWLFGGFEMKAAGQEMGTSCIIDMQH
jgi:hypothetical protein